MQLQLPVVEIRGATKVYGSGPTAVKAVDGLSIAIMPGEMVLVAGPSGSGKTTLLSMAGTLLKPSAGSVLVLGKDVTSLSGGELAQVRLRTFGFIFQEANLLSSLTALENVQFVMDLAGFPADKAVERARQLLIRFRLSEQMDRLPSQLSVGEKQRVAIARALANGPRLVLADEPTGSLDSKAGHEVMLLLRDLAKEEGRSVFAVSHDMRLLDLADRIFWMEDGKVTQKRADEVRS